MIRRNTLILLIILVFLIGLSVYLSNQKSKQTAQATPTAVTAFLFTATDGVPNDIKISDSTGQSVEINRPTNGTWGFLSPTVTAADQGSVGAALSQINALRILNNVELGLDVVGLDKPSYVINISYPDAKTHKLLVGSVTPIQNGYYVQLDGSQVQIVDKQGLDSILGLLTNPPYAATLTPIASATSTPEPATTTPEPTNTLSATSVPGTSTKSP
jgi:hypothetical protein